MRAFQLLAAGDLSNSGNFAVRTVGMPRPLAGEVLIKVKAASSHPIDYKMAGSQGEAMLSEFPFTMGTDVAGVVAEVGEGVADLKVGDEIAAYTAVDRADFGGFAEYCKAEAKLAIPKPKDMSFEDASTLGVAFTTTYTALDLMGVDLTDQKGKEPPPEVVVVLGGSSSVGQMAVQVLASYGYKVITTASPRNFEWLQKSLGAFGCVDYHSDDAVDDLKALTGGALVPKIFDCTGALPQAATFLAPGGVVMSIASFAWPDGVALPENAEFKCVGLNLINTPGMKKQLDLCHTVFRNYVAPKLQDKSFKPNPVEVVTGGLDSVLDTIRRGQKGMSAKTLVVTGINADD
mmetsp:Transcript_2561/g.8594  ORF Transcript_2561/g.8594 Transcript_2561/m.8594 type:complete len:347 (+) Transcript_2561:1407-2447(+)